MPFSLLPPFRARWHGCTQMLLACLISGIAASVTDVRAQGAEASVVSEGESHALRVVQEQARGSVARILQQGQGNTAGLRAGWPAGGGEIVLDGLRQERLQASSATLHQAGRAAQAALWQRDLADATATVRQEAGGTADRALIQQASGARQQAELVQAGEGQRRVGSIQQFGQDLQARLRQEQGASVADLEQDGSMHVLGVRLAGAAHGLNVLQQGIGMQASVDLDSPVPASLDLFQRGSGHVAFLRLRDTAGYQRIEQEGQGMRLHVDQSGTLQTLRVRQR